MTQKNLVVNGLPLKYNGIFLFDEFYKALKDGLTQRGYKMHEKRFEERVGDKGKDLFIELRPLKIKAAWLSQTMRIRIIMKHIREVVLDVDDIPTQFQEGEIDMSFDGWITYGIRHRWGNNPTFYFLKSVINKYVYRFPLEGGMDGEIASDTRFVHSQVKAHLGLYKFRVKEATPETPQSYGSAEH
ncbi:MAG TPA: hypothetical protein VJH88_03430 [Candidatus Nanoarchaeia archaeon]|nr:hypothetical protein [Candidatus Nanoarchaeia archaeon]